jgi:hypothetical protein
MESVSLARPDRGALIRAILTAEAAGRVSFATREHADVDPDVRLLLLSQSGRYK